MLTQKVKGGVHLAVLLLAGACGVYNFTRKPSKPKNKFLVAYYAFMVGVEVSCVIDHARKFKEEK